MVLSKIIFYLLQDGCRYKLAIILQKSCVCFDGMGVRLLSSREFVSYGRLFLAA